MYNFALPESYFHYCRPCKTKQEIVLCKIWVLEGLEDGLAASERGCVGGVILVRSRYVRGFNPPHALSWGVRTSCKSNALRRWYWVQICVPVSCVSPMKTSSNINLKVCYPLQTRKNGHRLGGYLYITDNQSLTLHSAVSVCLFGCAEWYFRDFLPFSRIYDMLPRRLFPTPKWYVKQI